MWSGPRNLSTAMMYSFAQRVDFEVVDEPFYAAYLAETGLRHPMYKETLATQLNEPKDVQSALGRPILLHRYEKHMAHHMLSTWDRSWLRNVLNVFLIRHPARVIDSYAKKREAPTLDDLGFRQQEALLRYCLEAGQAPVVIDSSDIRSKPEQSLTRLCEAIGVAFDRAMLKWSAGGKPYDGAWAPHWYGKVHQSTGFAGPEGPIPLIDTQLQPVLEAALPYYEQLLAHRLTFDT